MFLLPARPHRLALLLLTGLACLILAATRVASGHDAPLPARQTLPPATIADDTLHTIYVVPLSHLDIGYDITVPDLIPLEKQYLDEAMDYAEQYPTYRWTVENLWQLDQWLAQTSDPQQVQRLRGLIDQGKIELMAGYANMHQGRMGSEGFNRFLYTARQYETAWNLDLDTAMSNDVPGSSWALPQVLRKSGVRNLVAGINTTFGGRPDIPISDYIFNWQGVDGSKVLTWVSVKSYAEGLFYWGFTHNYPDMADATQQFIDAYENGGYPYDAVIALIGFDNDGPGAMIGNGLNNVAQWNAEHTWPQIVVATPSQFFDHMRQQYGEDAFTTYSGDWSGLWENNDMRYPVTIAQNRWTKNALPQAETLSAVRAGLNGTAAYPQSLFRRTYRDLIIQDEHSGPGGGFELTAAEIETNDVWFFDRSTRAYDTTQALLRRGLTGLAQNIQTPQPALVVYNGLSWPRTDRVTLPYAQWQELAAPGGSRAPLIDLETGQPVTLQGSADGQSLLFLAQNVPAFGYRLYGFAPDTEATAPPPTSIRAGNEIENNAYRITVDEATGNILSIYDKVNGRELVDDSAEMGFNQLLRADQGNAVVWGDWEPVPTGAVTVTVSGGPVQSELTIVHAAFPISETVITLLNDVPRVEIRNTIDHDRTDYADQETLAWYYYAAMPFALGESGFTGRFQGPNGWPSPQVDWIAGTSHNSRVIRDGSYLRAADGFGVTVASREVYLANFGSIPMWNGDEPEAPILFHVIFVRQDGTDTTDQGWIDFPTWEPGAPRVYTSHFALTSSPDGFAAAAAAQFSAAYNAPLQLALITQAQAGPLPGPTGSLLQASQPNVAALTLKRAEFENPDGSHLILRLQEIGGQPATDVTVTLPFAVDWAESNGLTEQRANAHPLPINPLRISLGPYETLTIRLHPAP